MTYYLPLIGAPTGPVADQPHEMPVTVVGVEKPLGNWLQSINSANRSPSIIAGKGDLYNALGGGASDSNFTNADGRIAARNGRASASNIRLVFGNFYAGASVDTDGPNPITVSAAIELGGTTVPVSFNGSLSVVINGRSGIVVSDPVGVTLAPGQLFAVRSNVVVSTGQQFPVGYTNASGSLLAGESNIGENQIRNTTASVVYNTGAITGTTVPGYGPLAILGETDAPAASVAIFGDSIADGSGDSAVSNLLLGQGLGFAARGLRLADDTLLPFVNLSRGGQSMDWSATLNGLDIHRRLSLLNYATHVLFAIGTNDVVGAPTLTALQDRYTRLWGFAKKRGKYTAQSLIMPRVSGTYATPAGQTPLTGFGVGGLRDQINAWIKAQVGQGLLDAVIDPNPYVEDPANPGKWATDAGALTADGVHPNAAGHHRARQAVQAWAATLV
jgi:lysophospholipase L1-like esterase